MIRKYIVRRSPQQNLVTLIKKGKGDEKVLIFALDVRAALVWPEIKAPGYVSVWALRNQMVPETRKFRVRLVDEFEINHPTKLFRGMFELSKYYQCQIFYADLLKKRNIDFVSMFNDYSRFTRDVTINLQAAPFAMKYNAGLALVQEYVESDALEMPQDSKILSQLGKIKEEDTTKEIIDEEFYAIKALMYILGSIEKDPWNIGHVYKPQQTQRNPKADFGAYT